MCDLVWYKRRGHPLLAPKVLVARRAWALVGQNRVCLLATKWPERVEPNFIGWFPWKLQGLPSLPVRSWLGAAPVTL